MKIAVNELGVNLKQFIQLLDTRTLFGLITLSAFARDTRMSAMVRRASLVNISSRFLGISKSSPAGGTRATEGVLVTSLGNNYRGPARVIVRANKSTSGSATLPTAEVIIAPRSTIRSAVLYAPLETAF